LAEIKAALLVTRIFDNIELSLGPHLQTTLNEHETMDAAIGYFNLRGWRIFADAIELKERIPEDRAVTRILIGMVRPHDQDETIDELQQQLDDNEIIPGPTDNESAFRRRAHLLQQLREQLCRGLPNQTDRTTLRKLRQQVESGKVQIKVHTSRPLHGKTYIFHRQSANHPVMGFVGSSNLTAAGLISNLELNVDVVDFKAAESLAGWFQERWDDRLSLTIDEDLLRLLDESWVSEVPTDPYLVYLKLCYDLSRDVREGLAEYSVDGTIDSVLLDYQREAVKTLARRIENRGGTMLGDVVGLGKTLTAVAVSILMRDEFGYSTLVVCPKNLETMWIEHMDAYQVHSKVVPYSMAAKELPNLGKYKFVIIDESHTMRNNERKDYIKLREYIREFDCRVLLLTATPYNVGFSDVANQLGLWIDPDEDLGLQPTVALGKNPAAFNRLDGKVSTLEAFRVSEEPDDWKRLMSEHLVRRTRTFIKSKAKTAGQIDERGVYLTFSNGEKFYFPKRIPRPLQHTFTQGDPAFVMSADPTFEAIDSFRLPRYDLERYVAKGVAHTPEEEKILEDWKRSRGQVKGFVRTNFYKRLSSCGHSFTLSMQRHKARNELFLYALNSQQLVPTGTILEAMFRQSDSDQDYDAELGGYQTTLDQYESLVAIKPRSVNWMRPEIFTNEFRVALETDTALIQELLDSFGQWKASADSKLQALIQLVATKHRNEKVLVFTEYADTANYLSEELRKAGVKDVEVATGDSGDPTKIARRFSPLSNQLVGGDVRQSEVGDPVRVLIATDVLSEGQNLQDAHIVVNYDLPWAIIKLIQRAGRVDRIGQKFESVIIYSLFHDSVENVLELRQRLAKRLSHHAKAFGADEQFFGTPEEVAIIKGAYDGTDLPEMEGDIGVDAASQAYLEWSSAIAVRPELAIQVPELPDLLRSTKHGPPPAGFNDGLACFVRTTRGFDAYGYADSQGGVQLVTGQEVLALFRCTPETPGMPDRKDNDNLLSALVRGQGAPLARPQVQAGQLRGTRKRVWNRLTGSLLSTTNLNDALDSLHRHPLTYEAERMLKKSLATGNLEALSELLQRLHREDRLTSQAEGLDPIHIVSSMGIQQ